MMLRVFTVGTLVIALAGPLRQSASNRLDVIFALDISRSIDRETVARALGFFNQAMERKPPDAYVGLVAFGADAGVEAVLREFAEPIQELSVDVRRGYTDIGRALEVAVGAFPTGGLRRIVLLSDGRENVGEARTVAVAARAIGVEINAIALEPKASLHEIHMQDLVAPKRVRIHEPFQVEMVVHSTRRTRANFVLMRNGSVIGERELELLPGVNTFSQVEQADQAGLFEYEAVVNSDADGIPENNRYQSFVRVLGASKVLRLVSEPGWGRHLSAALQVQGLAVEELPGDALPSTRHGLSDFDLIILDNVSGFDISQHKMLLLEDYVRDSGGVIALGGNKSYSGGGYYGTPVERLLPVSMDVKTQAKIPSVSVTIVLDRSGSMGSDDKLYIAKSAALAAVEVMNPLDEVSVLTFDDAPHWSVPPTPVGNRRGIAERLRLVASGGGTDLYLALEEARRATAELHAKVKHVIVLSDGLTDTESDFEGLVRQMAADQVTVSTVAFGDDADQGLLESIAAWGSGRYYFTDDPQNVPRIFTSETLVASRDLHVEKPVQPQVRFTGEMLEGFGVGSFPILAGYQRTFPKPTAQVLLTVGEEDPLLVSWRYGLGKSVAFMSDLSGRWGKAWVGWADFARFVGQMARWSMRQRGTETLAANFSWAGRRGQVSVDVFDRDDRYINGLTMVGALAGPSRDPSKGMGKLTFEQVAPGRYQSEFPVDGPGRYYVSVSGSNGTDRIGPRTFGLAIPYSTEYLQRGADHEHLRALANSTGGRLLPMAAETLSELFAPRDSDAEPLARNSRIWWPFVVVALALLVLEIAVRKLRMPESWQARLGRAAGHVGRERSDPGYEAWVRELDHARETHLAALHQGHAFDSDDPAVRARLHMARRAEP